MFGQAAKGPALEGVVLDILYARLDLALVLGRARPGGQDHGAIMLRETCQLGIEFRIEPIRLQHGRLEVVGHDGLGHTAKTPEGVFHAPQETLRILTPDHLAVAFARKAQGRPEHMRAAPLALGDHPGALTKVHLHLFAGSGLDAPERQR